MFYPSEEDERALSPVRHNVVPPTRSQSMCLLGPSPRKSRANGGVSRRKRSKSWPRLPAPGTNKDNTPNPAYPFFAAVTSGISQKRGFAHMTALERRILQRHMRRDTLNLADTFGSIHMGVHTYLVDTGCTLPQLMSCIMEVPFMKVRHLHRMRRATSISGVFLELIIKNLISFLQFSVVKHLLNTLCSEADSLHEKMATYEEAHYEYMLKRFFFNHKGAYRKGRLGTENVDSDSSDDDEEEEEMAEILIITDDVWDGHIPFIRKVEMERIVHRAYGITNFSLELVSF